jgi:acyl-CoA thioester hydrolase
MTAEDFDATYAWRREREVELSDLDVFRHVNNVRYAGWAESIRAAYFSDVLRRDMFGAGPGVILARHDLTYEVPLAWRERLWLGGRLLRFGTKSFDFEMVVWSQLQQRRAFRSLATLVAYDHDLGRSIPIPAEWRAAAAAYEKVAPC